MVAAALVVLIAPPARAATGCPNQITACGCVINTSGSYQVTTALTQSTVGEICLEVDASNVRLDLAGNSITGATIARPPRGKLDVGVFLARSATKAIVVGGGATISTFGTAGLEIESSGAIVSDLNADNDDDGIEMIGARGAQLIDLDASNNLANGLYLKRSSGNQISNLTANNNGDVGIFIFSSSDGNRITGFQTNSNSEGIQIIPTGCGEGPNSAYRQGCTPRGGQGNTISGGEANANQSDGIALEIGTNNTAVIGNTAEMNGNADLTDARPNCGKNLWFGNTFGVAMPSGCIH
jgi:parallel beta-helix repeat protein